MSVRESPVTPRSEVTRFEHDIAPAAIFKVGGALLGVWLLVIVGHLGGPLIHLLHAIATAMFLLNFLMKHDPESSWA